ncbi:MAG: chemotaxis protein, partial [Microcoleus sp. PH2017_03_ELD_O_A]|nr:chemotaxis protein [Microcoleus sp. PH2017_03_ELD_O_A]
VVASEIRKLADRSKKSAAQINLLVADIQRAINSTVMVTDEGTKTVESGVNIAEETAAAFAGVADAINNVVLSSQQISLNAKQQAIAIEQVVEAMNSLNQAAAQTACGITQTKIGTQKLNEAALDLKAVV